MDLLQRVARGERVRLDGADWLRPAAAEGLVGLLGHLAEDPPRQLQIQSVAIEAHAERMLTELARITAAFEAERVPLLSFKGPLLSQRLYGHSGLRSFSDLDLIVAPDNADRGETILAALGYRELEPLVEAERRTNRRFSGESLFGHDGNGVLADFHWRFSHPQFPIRIPFEEAWQRRQSMEISGRSFAALGDLDLAVTVCNHAAKHLWHRLEMLAQIAALTRLELDWDALDSLATRASVLRQMGISFLLARDLLDVTPPPLPRALAVAQPYLSRVRALVESNFRTDPRRNDATGSDLFLLFDRRADIARATLLAIFVPTHSDWHGSSLPASFQWAVRPWRLLGKRLGFL